jgi:hypothetical protein
MTKRTLFKKDASASAVAGTVWLSAVIMLLKMRRKQNDGNGNRPGGEQNGNDAGRKIAFYDVAAVNAFHDYGSAL